MRKFVLFVVAVLFSMLSFVVPVQAQSLETEQVQSLESEQTQLLDRMLESPEVDDIYVARLDYISDSFKNKVFGMLRVIKVEPNRIVVITEDAAWPNSPNGAYDDLKGKFLNIEWDDKEEIVIRRSRLIGLKEAGTILDGRRLTPEEISRYLN